MNFKPNDDFFYYLYFIQERMNVFYNRQQGGDQPYSDDIIFQQQKFTNTYRVLDRSSQYLLDKVIYDQKGLDNDRDTEDIFWRIMLYKHFNLPKTWDYLTDQLGEISLEIPIKDIVKVLYEYQAEGNVVYSNAYMLTCPFMKKESFLRDYCLPLDGGLAKFEIYLRIFERDLFEKGMMYKILSSTTFEQAFNEMKGVLGIADFLSYQLVQDLNYSQLFNFDDNEFCAAGPGTQRGIHRTFDIVGKPNYNEIVKWVQKNYHQLVEDYSKRFGIDLTAKELKGWSMKVPDFSNCGCETDKLMRQVAANNGDTSQGRMKQKFIPSNTPINFMFPPKWGEVSL